MDIKGWDVTLFGICCGGMVAAVWMIVEAVFPPENIPSYWRVYTVVLSLGLAFHCFDSCRKMWSKRHLSEPPPDHLQPSPPTENSPTDLRP